MYVETLNFFGMYDTLFSRSDAAKQHRKSAQIEGGPKRTQVGCFFRNEHLPPHMHNE